MRLSVTLPQKLIDEIKEKDINISRAFEDYFIDYLKNYQTIKKIESENVDLWNLWGQFVKNHFK